MPRPLAAARRALLALAAAVASLAAAAPARAEEALVLDNGAILRGTVLRDDGSEVVLRLAGVGKDSKVTIERARIVQRFVTVEAQKTSSRGSASGLAPVEPVVAVRLIEPTAAAVPPPLPAEEPRAAEEDFFSRTARRAALALPSQTGPRLFLILLAFMVELCLVLFAGRMIDVASLTLAKSAVLASLFVGLVGLAIVSSTTMRADQAPLFVPLAVLAWVGCAAGMLRCGLGRAFNLLAFVLLSTALVVFSTGIVLVSV